MLFQKKGRDESVDLVVKKTCPIWSILGRSDQHMWLLLVTNNKCHSNGRFKWIWLSFHPVENYKSTGKWEPAMMLWALIWAIMGCKDLFAAIAEKRLPFWYNGWEGHLLTHLCLKYTKYADVKVKSSSGSPFKASKNNTIQDILDRIKLEPKKTCTGKKTCTPVRIPT